MTWAALVEAGHDLGDRYLYLHSPMLRGEDVGELQRQLSTLGFDPGRVDGIFGPETLDALEEFQRNTGLVCDGIFGPDTATAMARLGPRRRGLAVLASLRERDALLSEARTLSGLRVAVADPGGLGSVAAAIRRRLNDSGARVLTIHHHDGSAQAAQANRFGAAAFVGLAARTDPIEVCYYEVPGYASFAGRHLAHLTVAGLGPGPGRARGMRLPVLRETRMPAIVCRLGTPVGLGPRAPELADAIVGALDDWVRCPVAPGESDPAPAR